MKPKRRKIRLSFIGGRRPVFIDDKPTSADNKDNESKEDEATINKKGEVELTVQVSNRTAKDNALISEYASGKNPSKRNNGVSSNMLESTLCTNNLKEMNEMMPEFEKELEKWKLLTSDFVFNTFEEVETNSEIANKSKLLEEQEQDLLKNHMELCKKNLRLKELHSELEAKKEILQFQINSQTNDDSVLGVSVMDTPRHLIKKIISLN